MEGYLYMLIIFLLLFKCSIYFCWYKARRERYLSAQRQETICTIQRPHGNNVYIQNSQANVISPVAHRNQGLVEHPVAPHYQHPMPQDKPPAYNDVGGIQDKGMYNQPPPNYYYATTYPATGGGPTSPGVVPSAPTSTTVPYPNPTSAPTSTTVPYPYQSPGAAPYPFMATGLMSPGTAAVPYMAGVPISPGTAPVPYVPGGPTNHSTTPYPASTGANLPPYQM